MLRAACLIALVAACTESAPPAPTSELELAAADTDVAIGKADGGWSTQPTLHVGERVFGRATAGGRAVYPLWVAGSAAAPVTLDIVTTARESDVRIAVLGPLTNGARTVIAAAGYGTPRTNLELTTSLTTSGEHLVVVGSFDLATATAFDVGVYCPGCAGDEVDVIAEPKAGALVATETGIVAVQLGRVLDGRRADIAVDLWASPPAQPWNARKVATSIASGTQANIVVPASVAAGDDLQLVVREGATVIDSGVVTRFFPRWELFARTDALLYGDIASIGASGVVGYYEGVASLSLRSETHRREIAAHDLHISLPGQVGNGYGAFDASFIPELELPSGELNPVLPRNGELLSVGFLNGNGDYVRLGCFEYCNNLSGEETCTGETRACPAAAW